MEETQYLCTLLKDLTESSDKCEKGYCEELDIYDEISILKRIIYKLSKPKIIKKTTIKEKIINQNGEKLELPEIMRHLKNDRKITHIRSNLRNYSVVIDKLKSKLSKSEKVIDKIHEQNKNLSNEMSIMSRDFESLKNEIKAIIERNFNE